MLSWQASKQVPFVYRVPAPGPYEWDDIDFWRFQMMSGPDLNAICGADDDFRLVYVGMHGKGR